MPTELTTELDLLAVFAALPGPAAVFAADAPRYTLVAVSDALVAANGRPREELVGLPLDEAFPDRGRNPSAASALGSLRASFDDAVRTGTPQRMPRIRYDFQSPDGTKSSRYWDTTNTPVRGADGAVRWVLHQTENVTAKALGEQALADRARAEAALRESEARLRLALDIAGLGTWSFSLVDGSGDLDPRAAEIVGLPAGEFADVAEAQRRGTHPDDLAPMQAAVAAGIASGQAFDLAYRVILPDGSVHHVASRARVVTDASGRPVRLVGTNRDVSAERVAAAERERLLAATEAARAEAEVANQAKSRFLAVMSHELRTPLNAIGGYVELIEMGIRGPVTADQREDLRRIRASQRHLLGLINEVLSYARIETGTVHYDLADVRLRETLGEVEALIMPQARTRGLVLTVAESADSLVVRADPEKLRQVLLNLLSNAVKFTSPGGRVDLWCEDVDGCVRVHVRDTGVGIPVDKQEAVFEPFVQVRSELTRAAEGAGLGLAISRDLARGMGGDLTVESAVGVGSTFTLTLPRAG